MYNTFYTPLSRLKTLNCFHLNCINNLNSRVQFKAVGIKSVLSGAVFGKDCYYLIDSGASFSVINTNFLPKNALLDPVNINCITVTGKDIKLNGEISTNIQLHQHNDKCVNFKQKFVVSDEFTENFVILGSDFLMKYKCNLCFENN